MDAVVYVNEIFSKKIQEVESVIGEVPDVVIGGTRFFSAGYTKSCRETLVDEIHTIQKFIIDSNIRLSFESPCFICDIEEDFNSKYKSVILKTAQILFNNRMNWLRAYIKEDALYVAGKKFIEVFNYKVRFFYYFDLSFFYKRDAPLISLFIFLIRNVNILEGRILPEDYVYIFDVLDADEKDSYGYDENQDEEDQDYDQDYNYINSREVLLSVFGYWFINNYPGEFSALLNNSNYYFNGIATLMSGMIDQTKEDIKKFLLFLKLIGNPQIPDIFISWFGRSFTIEELKKLTEVK